MKCHIVYSWTYIWMVKMFKSDHKKINKHVILTRTE
jgi:hypothetical protein